MRANRRRTRPVVEQFETRTLLSAGLAHSAVSTLLARQGAKHVVPLNGTFRGNYSETRTNPDTGYSFSPMGSGQVKRLGHFGLAGQVQTVGFIAVGTDQGTLTLSSAKGTLTLSLSAQVEGPATFSLPTRFTYTVSSATGQYKHIHDSGTATLTITPTTPQAPASVSQGLFTLVLKSSS